MNGDEANQRHAKSLIQISDDYIKEIKEENDETERLRINNPPNNDNIVQKD